MKRYPFRKGWVMLSRRMLGWGLSAATVLWIFDRLYVQVGVAE